MHPILFTLPNGFEVHTYGVLIAVGTLLAVLVTNRWAIQEGLPKETMTDIAFWSIVGAVVGARAEFVRVNWAMFADQGIGKMLNVRDGGLVFYGGLLAVLVVFVGLIRQRGLPMMKVLDILAPMIPFGQMFGRLGCFAAGCCHGVPTDVPWAVTFTDPRSVAPRGVSMHPTQLYEVGYSFLLLLLLLAMRSRKRFDGQLILTYLTLYPILRSINELFRGDIQRGYVFESLLGRTVTNAQFFSLLIALAAGAGWLLLTKLSRQTRKTPASKS